MLILNWMESQTLKPISKIFSSKAFIVSIMKSCLFFHSIYVMISTSNITHVFLLNKQKKMLVLLSWKYKQKSLLFHELFTSCLTLTQKIRQLIQIRMVRRSNTHLINCHSLINNLIFKLNDVQLIFDFICVWQNHFCFFRQNYFYFCAEQHFSISFEVESIISVVNKEYKLFR